MICSRTPLYLVFSGRDNYWSFCAAFSEIFFINQFKKFIVNVLMFCVIDFCVFYDHKHTLLEYTHFPWKAFWKEV